MDEAQEVGRLTGRLVGKAVNTVAEHAEKERWPDKVAQHTAAIEAKYEEKTGHRLRTDAKIASVAGAAGIGLSVAAMAPTIAIGAAVGAATYEVAANSEAAAKAKQAYETNLGRDFARDKATVKSGAKAGIQGAKQIGKSFVQGYKSVRQPQEEPRQPQ
ncbi:Senescence domain-containing protein [Plasmodiophora brassicae]